MRVPLSWLRDFAPFEAPVEALADALSDLGLVVDGVERVGAELPGIVVARVLATGPHPDADRIQLVQVDPGDGGPLQICCGAFNMAAGDLVPLATLGTVMPGGLEIARRKMRGQWSNGMLCSAEELGLPDPGEGGILVLSPGLAQPGTPLAEALDLRPDAVFDLDISPNRPDALSVLGVARDLAAAFRLALGGPAPVAAASPGMPAADVEVAPGALDACPRFTGTVVEVPAGAVTPPWMARRLTLAGMRPIGAVVDASNYVMLELGQPNHPYDLRRLGGGGLRVRRGRPGEELVTLDGVARRLQPGDCVIADATDRAVGLAGIMGGAGSGIAPDTTTVLLEAAWFDPRAVAATGGRLGLASEARARFERGVDPELAERAVARFVDLLPGARRGPTTDRRSPAHLPVPATVELRTARVNRVLGTELDDGAVADPLGRLGFDVAGAGPGRHRVEVPSWRPDCQREVDLIEEVARLRGYATIPRALPVAAQRAARLTPLQRGRRRLRDVLVGAGFSEAWTSTFVSREALGRAGLAGPGLLEPVEVQNPLDQSAAWLRTSLVPGLAQSLRANRDRQAGAVRLFEIGQAFSRAADPGAPLPAEWEELAVLAVGEGADAALAARLWALLGQGLRLADARLEPLEPSAPGPAHPARRARALVDGAPAGTVGELSPEVTEALGLPGRVALVVVDVGVMLAGRRRSWRSTPVSRYPATDIDLAFVLDEEVAASAVEDVVAGAAGELAESVVLFDVWRGEALGPGRRSLAFHLRLRAADRTLTDDEVAGLRAGVVAAVAERCGGRLRGA